MLDAFAIPASVLVLGGNSDIGRAIAAALIDQGTRRVGLAVRRPADASSAGEDLLRRADGVDVEVMAFDATADDYDWVYQRVTEDDWDAVVVAFGDLGDQPSLLANPSDARALLELNYVSAGMCVLGASDALRARGQGILVVLSSVAALRARSANFLYASTKAGLDSLALGVADQNHGTGVRTYVVRPGFVRSKMTEGLDDQPFATTPEAVAADVVAAIGRSSSAVVYSPAVTKPLYVALRALPRVVWRRISK